MKTAPKSNFTRFALGWIGFVLAAAAIAGGDPHAAEDPAEAVLREAARARWIAEGDGTRILYVFFDPNCPYCHKVYVKTRPWVERGEVQVRWIPIGILTPTSAGKAAAILQAEDPLQAFRENEEGYERGHGGGIAEDFAEPDTEAALEANAARLAQTGSTAVPALLFRDQTGKAFLLRGVPPDSILSEILQTIAVSR